MICIICGAEYTEVLNTPEVTNGVCTECLTLTKDIRDDDYLLFRDLSPDAMAAAYKKHSKLMQAFDRGYERGVVPHSPDYKKHIEPDYEKLKQEYIEFLNCFRKMAK